MKIEPFYDDRTHTMAYVVYDEVTRDAVVIDPVLDHDPEGSTISYEAVDDITAFARAERLRLHFVLETHAHADHLSGSQVLRRRFRSAKTAIGRRITEVQRVLKGVFGLPSDFPTDGRQFDCLFDDGDMVHAGSLRFEVIFTPGHTPACATYRFDDAIFTGATLLMPDRGTGRCDLPAGSARDLYRSIATRIYTLPEDTRVFVGHDGQPRDRPLAFETTVGAEKRENVELHAGRNEEDFVRLRNGRDTALRAPRLLLQSVQVELDAGQPGRNEVRYVRIPINAFRPEDAGPVVQDSVR